MDAGATKNRKDPSDRNQVLSWLLESLANAANALLTFKRRDIPVRIPAELLRCANLVFTQAEQRSIQAEDWTVSRAARRLTAANSHNVPNRQPITIDDQGRIFNEAGERLFEFDPARVLSGRQELLARKRSATSEVLSGEGTR